jgi:hypothetical protein
LGVVVVSLRSTAVTIVRGAFLLAHRSGHHRCRQAMCDYYYY